jgi:hypothetical protein
VRRETGDKTDQDQTDQESRSGGHAAAASMITMDITRHASSRPHDDPDASVAFYHHRFVF